MGWLSDAPRAIDFIIEPAAFANEAGQAFPSIAFAFRGADDENITVSLIGSPETLRLFHRHYMKALTKAEHFATTKQRELDDARRETIRRNSEGTL